MPEAGTPASTAAARRDRVHSEHRRRGIDPPAAPAAPLQPRRLTVVLWVGIGAVLVLHVAASLSSRGRLWGFDALRFLPPAAALAIGIAWALLLVPALTRRIEPAWIRFGSRIAPWLVMTVAALTLLPDRLYFLGDWMMRRGSVTVDAPLDLLYPQALPLDLLIHVHGVRALAGVVGADLATRIAGGLAALLLVIAVGALKRRLGLGPVAGAAFMTVAIASGCLQLFTGFNKAACEMLVVTAAAMALAVSAPSSRVSTVGLGIVVAVGLLLHRVGVLLIPGLVVSLALRSRAAGGRRERWIPIVAALVPPALVLIAIGPRLLRVLVTFDWPRHLAPPAGHGLAGAMNPGHLADVANALGILAPLAAAAMLLPRLATRARVGEWMPLAAFALPLAATLVVVHPQQGVFRDLDVLAPGAFALGVVAAWCVARAIERDARGAGLGVAIAATCLASTVSWLALDHRPEQGRAWVRGFATAEAGRSDRERALTWDYLGYQAMDAGDWVSAAAAWREATRLAPSPRMLTLLGMSETMLGNLREARALFRSALELEPALALAWRGIATTAFRLGDYREARQATVMLRRLGASPPELVDLLRELDRIEGRSGAREGEEPTRLAGRAVPHGIARIGPVAARRSGQGSTPHASQFGTP